MVTIQIPIRELHARTGHFVRKAAGNNMRVVVTDNGKPVAQIQAIATDEKAYNEHGKWKNRVLLPEFAAIMNIPVHGTDSTEIITEDRNR